MIGAFLKNAIAHNITAEVPSYSDPSKLLEQDFTAEDPPAKLVKAAVQEWDEEKVCWTYLSST